MGKEYIRQVDARLCQMPADNVLVLEDFVTIVNWSSSGTGSDYAITRDTSTYMKSSFGIDTPGSLKIVTRTTTPAQYDICNAIFTGPMGQGQKLILSGRFRSDSIDGDGAAVRVSCNISNGTNVYQPGFTIYPNAHVIKYRSGPNSYTDVLRNYEGFVADVWYSFSLAFNISTGKYISLFIGGREFDLSNLSFSFNADPASYSTIVLSALTESAFKDGAHYDLITLVEAI